MKCKAVVSWVSGREFWIDRWVHLDVVAWAEFGPHRAEVAGD